jgi:hypothetical protein
VAANLQGSHVQDMCVPVARDCKNASLPLGLHDDLVKVGKVPALTTITWPVLVMVWPEQNKESVASALVNWPVV